MSSEKEILPITPQEILEGLPNIIPSFVFEAVNNLLKKKFRGESAYLMQDDIMEEIARLQTTYTRQEIYDNKWMDFESVYAAYGWMVEYDNPSYEPSFKFSIKK
jgi:hypothetical protein